jgi:uncharacterized protein
LNPILFGTRERQLFGIHTPGSAGSRPRGVVICPPLGYEYQRAHRAIRMLAQRLSDRGCDVLRFDYYGTGDSAGHMEEVTLSGCVQDVHTAVEELRAIADQRRVTVVGLRAGAVVAQRAAAEARAIERVVLWDPIVAGAGYLEYLANRPPNPEWPQRPSTLAFYGLMPAVQAELAQVDVASIPPAAPPALLIASDDTPEHGSLAEQLRGAGQRIDFEVHPNPPAWEEEAALGIGALPVTILDRITEWVQQ